MKINGKLKNIDKLSPINPQNPEICGLIGQIQRTYPHFG
jgi:hypothetical protein